MSFFWSAWMKACWRAARVKSPSAYALRMRTYSIASLPSKWCMPF